MEALYVVVVIIIVVVAQQFQKARDRTTDAAWQEVADRLDGSFEAGERSWFKAGTRRLTVTLHGVPVVVDHYMVGSGKNQQVYTRLACDAHGPSYLRIEVSQAGVLSGVARALGFQDVEVGDPEFDQAYVVKSSHPSLAKLWLHAKIRQAIAAARRYTFKLAEGELTAQRLGLEDDAEQLVEAIEAAVALCDGRGLLTRRWGAFAKTLANGRVTRLRDGWARIEGEHEGTPVRVSLSMRDEQMFTVVRAAFTGSKPSPMTIARDRRLSERPRAGERQPLSGGDEYFVWADDRTVERVGEPLIAAVERLAPAIVEVGGEDVMGAWPGILTRAGVLGEVVALCASLARAEGRGPYR